MTAKRKEVVKDAHGKKTESMVQKTLERNKQMLEKAQALQETLAKTSKELQNEKTKAAPAMDTKKDI